MAHSSERAQYEDFAGQYDTYTSTPASKLEGELITAALRSIEVEGKTVVDLAGGTGLHARKAIDMGAACVDVVDISSEMVNLALAAEEKLGRKDKLRGFVADAAGDMSGLGLRPQYDIAMVNWLLDHATSEKDLDAFWRNIKSLLKPGGIFVGVRTANPRSPSVTQTTKYGLDFRDFRDIPGGVAIKVYMHVEPPIEFGATIMDKMHVVPAAMYEEHGFEDIKFMKLEDMEIIKEDPEFWKMVIDDPFLAVVTARKGS